MKNNQDKQIENDLNLTAKEPECRKWNAPVKKTEVEAWEDPNWRMFLQEANNIVFKKCKTRKNREIFIFRSSFTVVFKVREKEWRDWLLLELFLCLCAFSLSFFSVYLFFPAVSFCFRSSSYFVSLEANL